jgi:hypothetical protein
MHGGERGKENEGRLKEGHSFWLRRFKRSKEKQSSSTFMVGW